MCLTNPKGNLSNSGNDFDMFWHQLRDFTSKLGESLPIRSGTRRRRPEMGMGIAMTGGQITSYDLVYHPGGF